jgi:hypothetical protein
MYYSDIHYPGSGKAALDETTGQPLHEGTLSSGRLAFAVIARVIVEHSWALDRQHVDELTRLLRL